MPKGLKGADNNKAKLSDRDVLAIRASDQPQRFLAARFGVSVDTIASVRSRTTWQHLPEITKSADTEIWKPIMDPFPGRYEASNFGRIRSVKATRSIRRTKIVGGGYVRVVLTCDYKIKFCTVHRLVAAAFLGQRPEGLFVNHKNGNKQDNRAENLEYVTPQENIRHAHRTGLHGPGERNGRAKLTTADVMAIRASADTSADLARRYDVRWATIDSIRRGQTWRHLLS